MIKENMIMLECDGPGCNKSKVIDKDSAHSWFTAFDASESFSIKFQNDETVSISLKDKIFCCSQCVGAFIESNLRTAIHKNKYGTGKED